MPTGSPASLAPQPLEGWKTVVADAGYDRKRLGAIEYALSAAGIPAEWNPFPPNEAPLLKLFGLRETRFWLRVPRRTRRRRASWWLTWMPAEATRRADGYAAWTGCRERGPRPEACVLYFLG